MKNWSEKEIEFLREYYPLAGRDELCKSLGKSWYGIVKKAWKLGIKREVREGLSSPWTILDIEFLKSHYPWEDREVISEVLGKTWNRTKKMASRLKVRRRVRHGTAQWIVNRNIPAEDSAYIAGFLDGEGCITVSLSTVNGVHYAYPCIDITNTNKDVLEWICGTIGQPLKGSLGVQKRLKRTQRDGWELRIRGRLQMVVLLRQIAPYLKVKRKQAEILLRYLESDTTSRSLQALKYALAVREATDSYRESDIYSKERLIKIIRELESQTSIRKPQES